MKKLLLFLLLLTSFNLSAQTNNYSLEFDGMDDNVNAGSNINFDNTSFTILIDVKLGAINQSTSFLQQGYPMGGLNNSLHLVIQNNQFGFRFYSNDLNTSTTFTDLNTWYKLACTYNASSGERIIYVDGQIVAQDVTSSLSMGAGYDLYFGSELSVNFFNGKLDNASVWDNALTLQTIQQYMICPPINNGTYNFGSSISGLAQYFNGKLDDIGIWNRALDSCEVKDLFDGSLGNCCTSNPITSQPANQSTSIGNDATFSFTDNLTGATYQWQMNAGTGYSDLSNAGQFSGTDTQTLTISSTSMSNNNTLYRCVVTESASCSDTTDVVTLTVSESGTSINELNSALVKIYPNPSDGIINLVLNDYSAGKIVLTDMLGKEVLNKSFTSKEVQINLKSLASKGTYFAKVIDLDGNIIAIKKLIYQ